MNLDIQWQQFTHQNRSSLNQNSKLSRSADDFCCSNATVQRKTLSAHAKATLAAKQGNCCAICNEELQKHLTDIDHKIALHLHGSNDPHTNLQAICVECHRLKTVMENQIEQIRTKAIYVYSKINLSSILENLTDESRERLFNFTGLRENDHHAVIRFAARLVFETVDDPFPSLSLQQLMVMKDLAGLIPKLESTQMTQERWNKLLSKPDQQMMYSWLETTDVRYIKQAICHHRYQPPPECTAQQAYNIFRACGIFCK